MKKIITGIIILFCVVSVVFVPLSARAEMKVMTDSEMQMVSGQISVAGLVGMGDTVYRSTMLKMGLSPALVYTVGTTVATPITNNCLVMTFQSTSTVLVNFDVPRDIFKAFCNN